MVCGHQLHREEAVSRIVAVVVLVLAGFCGASSFVQAQSTCAQCRDQLKACSKNYAGKTCKSEYDICMKGCKKWVLVESSG